MASELSSRGGVQLIVLSIDHESGVLNYESEGDSTVLYLSLAFMVIAATFFTLVILGRILTRSSA